MKKKIINKLLTHKKKNISILGFIENYSIRKFIKEGDTVLILGESDYLGIYISSDCKRKLENVMKKYDFETKYFASLEKWMVPVIARDSLGFSFDREISCVKVK